MAESTQQIWMEGRVVGLSAHEIYLRQQMAVDPNTTPATEREWLAATLASGASVLLHIPTSGAGVGEFDHNAYDFKLPEHSKLCAANTVVASYFAGEGVELDGYNYAKYVKSYGQLIPNTPENHPTGTVADYDSGAIAGSLTDWSADEVSQLRDYMKIVDGVVLQPGTWTDSTVSHDPVKDFTPDLSKPATVRLHIKGQIKQDFWIVLTGFSMRAVVVGESKFETGSLNTDNPQDGDYLGPETYPWANKIVFTVPTAAIKYQSQYARQINNKAEKQVADTSIIDFRETDPATYYTGTESAIARTSVTVPLNVTQAVSMLDNTAVLTVYQRSSKFAPALFGTFVKQEGQQKLNPIDTVAPRTLKLFHAEPDATAKDFENSIPLNYALIRHNDDYVLRQLDNNKNVIPVAEATVSQSGGIYKVTHTHGKVKVKSVAITRADGTDLPMTGTGGTVQDDMLTWADLLKYLANDNQIDTIGSILREFRETIVEFLPRGEEGKQYAIEIVDGEIRLAEFDAVKIRTEDQTLGKMPVIPKGGTDAQVVMKDMKRSIMTASTAQDECKAVSFKDKSGVTFPGTGVNGTIQLADGDPGFNWNTLLAALNGNYRVDAVGARLRAWRSALDSIQGDNKAYSVTLHDGQPAVIETPIFPQFVKDSVCMEVLKTGTTSTWIKRTATQTEKEGAYLGMVHLDVFGYASEISGINTANMMTTLSCAEGMQAIGAQSFRQIFRVDKADFSNTAAWDRLVDYVIGLQGFKVRDYDEYGNVSKLYDNPIYVPTGQAVNIWGQPSSSPVSTASFLQNRLISLTIPIVPVYKSDRSNGYPYSRPSYSLYASASIQLDGDYGKICITNPNYGWGSGGFSSRAFACALVLAEYDQNWADSRTAEATNAKWSTGSALW